MRRFLILPAILIGGYLLWTVTSRMPVTWPPYPETNVAALFPDDIVVGDGPDDHGWWGYTMNPDSERDPHQLCEAVHAAMVEEYPWAVPGIGVVIGFPPSTDVIPREVILPDGSRVLAEGKPNPDGPYWHAYCGSPDWFGRDPRGE